MIGSQLPTIKKDVTGDNDKRDILDLLKLSYIVVRTGIGTGQIMVMKLMKEKNDKMNM